MNVSEMAEIRFVLMRMLANVVNQDEIAKHGLKIENSADQLDRATNEADRMTAAALVERDKGLIAELRTALERIDQGTYGVCDRCEEEIAQKRLEAVPWATLCRDCQEYQERIEKDRNLPPVRKLHDHGKVVEAEARGRMGSAYQENQG